MAKELPYFKFEPSEWLEGEIQIISDEAIVCFINLCSGYWLKLGCISYAFALNKYCRKDKTILQELISNNIVEVINEEIRISFLDNQFKEFKGISEKRSKAAKKRWEKHTDNEVVNANAMQNVCKSNAIREDKIREDKIIIKKTVFNFRKALVDFGFKENLVIEWLKVRKNKKATNSETAFNGFTNQVLKTNLDINYVLKECVERSWSGFKYHWLEKEKNSVKKEKVNAGELIKQKYGLN